MAADDFSTLNGPWCTQRTAALPNAGTNRAVLLPDWCRRVTVWFFASDGTTAEIGKVAAPTNGTAYTTDVTAIGNNYVPVGTGGLSWAVVPGTARASSGGGGHYMYITGSTNNGYAQIMMESGDT